MYFLIFLIIGAGVVLLVLQQKGKLPAGKVASGKLPTVERNLFNLEIGDLVQYQGDDWFVEGKLIYNDSGDTWFSYLLQNDDGICWLSIEEDDLVEVGIYKKIVMDLDNPPATTLEYLEAKYHQSGQGVAVMKRLGNTLDRQEETCEYYDYEGDRNLRLSVEVWNGEIEVSAGEKVNPRMLTFLPGDGQKVYG